MGFTSQALEPPVSFAHHGSALITFILGQCVDLQSAVPRRPGAVNLGVCLKPKQTEEVSVPPSQVMETMVIQAPACARNGWGAQILHSSSLPAASSSLNRTPRLQLQDPPNHGAESS